jgi:hypothetical protein
MEALSVIELRADLKSNNTIPPIQFGGIGLFKGKYDAAARTLLYCVTFMGLNPSNEKASGAGFYGPSDTTHNAPLVLQHDGDLTSPLLDRIILSSSQEQDLLAGRWYFLVSSPDHPNGEIRGQIEKTGIPR